MARSATALRGQILESALDLFALHGFRGASLQDIATDAGCSKASLLYHFANKDAILTELLTPAGAGLAELNGQLAALDGEEAVTRAVHGYVDLALRFRRELRILLEDLPRMASHPALGVGDLAEGLLTAMAGGSSDAEARVAAHMVLGGVFVTSAGDIDVPHEVLRDGMIRSALRTLGHDH
ncbi:TetR family transcriptional regulator [Streptomyces sp. HNM0574]|uniref:TetR/AcrR family transcriptional regulator n=1 Tax=Streptomyces sp. HNM0574 TaxID=2714954 RepID=UPI00146CF451|nr:TetR family transcriptional regulator [Streptomyces sp. HNM0574]NLU70392.1 TetR/AcrR family transcriptional regulator [Streptomyces sp. HNM0574]